MGKFTFRMLIICFALGFGLFFALDVATNGMDKTVNGAKDSVSETANPSPVGDAATQGASGQAAGQRTQPSSSTDSTTEPMTAANARLQAAIAQVKQLEAEQAKEVEQSQLKQNTTQPAPMPIPEDSFVNRLSNKIGDVLRRMALGVIHLFVALFKLVLG